MSPITLAEQRHPAQPLNAIERAHARWKARLPHAPGTRRLLFALGVWLGAGSVAALLPDGSVEQLGLLATPLFWCLLLPTLALALHETAQSHSRRLWRGRRSRPERIQARRRSDGRAPRAHGPARATRAR